MKTSEEFTMFKKSRPWGYFPKDVEEKINYYKNALEDISSKYIEEKQISMNLAKKVEDLQNELRDMHLQMSSMELPEPEEAVGHFVLQDFKSYNNRNMDDEDPLVDEGFNQSILKEKPIFNFDSSNNDDGNDDALPFNIVK